MTYERSMLLDAENPPEHDEAELEELNDMAADAAYERLRDQRDGGGAEARQLDVSTRQGDRQR